MSTGYASAAEMRRDVSVLLRPPRRMPVAEAVKKYMRVPMGGGSAVQWEDTLTPYIIEPMNCLTSRKYDAVIFVGPARTGKSLGLIDGWIVYTIVCDPADFLLIQMTEEKAREHSKKRLDRTFRASPEVAKRLSPRTNDNNVHDKTFRAGNYLKIGWPSVNIMSSSDYRFVALTDYDRFPEDIDGEGDAFSLASKRTTTFMSAGMTLVESSPGREITDQKWTPSSPHEAPPTTGILSLYNRGDRQRWYWPCPHCGEYFLPVFDAVAGYRDDPDPVTASEAAYIECPHCTGHISGSEKRKLNNLGVWLKDGQEIDRHGNITGDARRSRIASFWMEGPAAAYQTLSQLVYKYLTAEQEYELTLSEETLKTVINTDWGCRTGRNILRISARQKNCWRGLRISGSAVCRKVSAFWWQPSTCRPGKTAGLWFRSPATVKKVNAGLWTGLISPNPCGRTATASVSVFIPVPIRRTGSC